MNRRSIRTLQKRVDKILNTEKVEIPLMVMQDECDGKWYRFDSYGTTEELIEVDIFQHDPGELHLMGAVGWDVEGNKIE